MNITDRLAEIQARAANATDGPWEVQEEEWAVISSGSDSVLHAFAVEKDCIECGTPQDECDTEVVLDIEDAEFIAHARTDVPALVAALKVVLDMHRSDGHEPWSCGEPECVASCTACEWDYPCPTVRAVEAALGEALAL